MNALGRKVEEIDIARERVNFKTQIVAQLLGTALLIPLLFSIFYFSSSPPFHFSDFYPYGIFVLVVALLLVVSSTIKYLILAWRAKRREW